MWKRILVSVFTAIIGATLLGIVLSTSFCFRLFHGWSDFAESLTYRFYWLAPCTAIVTFFTFICIPICKTLEWRVVVGAVLGGGLGLAIESMLSAFSATVWGHYVYGHEFLCSVILFGGTGTGCGAWIGRQAWRATNFDVPLFPRFSLATLLFGVIAWGALLAVFAPK